MHETSNFANLRRRRQAAQGHARNEDTNRRDRRQKSYEVRPTIKRQLVAALATVVGIGAWYLTPVSDWLTSLLLHQIPIEADIEMGRSALLEFPYKTIYHSHWSPLVSQVGFELIATLEKAPKEIIEEARGSSSNFMEDIIAGLDSNFELSPSSLNLKNYQWDFGVVRAPIVNAFALPGGIIRVTDQLLDTLQPTRGELASLLGHEIGHALLRHSQKRIMEQKMLSLVLSAITHEDNDDDDESFGEALGELLLNGAKWFGQQKFSRRDEYQADATGWALLQVSRRYNPKSVQSLLNKLWNLQGKSDTPLDWMSTHPATESRIEVLKEKWQRLSRSQQRRLEYYPI